MTADENWRKSLQKVPLLSKNAAGLACLLNGNLEWELKKGFCLAASAVYRETLSCALSKQKNTAKRGREEHKETGKMVGGEKDPPESSLYRIQVEDESTHHLIQASISSFWILVMSIATRDDHIHLYP